MPPLPLPASPPLRPASRQRRVIVTGDDFGLNSQVNEAVEALHEAGLLTQTSLMVNEAGVDEALRIAQRHPRLRIGLHLSLCLGRASRPSALTSRQGNQQLSPTPAEAGLRYAFDRRLHPALEREIAAQFEAFAGLGLPAIYWDGHTHLHLHPTVLKYTVPVAQEHGYRATRLVREPGYSPLALIFKGLSRAALPQLTKIGVRGVDRVFGLQQTGKITTAAFQRFLERVPEEGWTEIYLHPGAEPSELDTAALLRVIEARGIHLGHAGELGAEPQSVV